MQRLRAWQRRQVARERRRPMLEEALLGNRMASYALYRLRSVAVARLFTLLVHVVEFVFLSEIFKDKRFVVSLVVQNGCYVGIAFWWGCLEVLRVRLRAERSKSRRTLLIERWLGLSIAFAFGVFVAALAVLGGSHAIAPRSFNPIDLYAALCVFRLSLDLVGRTYYSGVYAHQRIYRPWAAIILPEVIGISVIAAGWSFLGVWSFPAGLAVSTILSRAATFYYVTRAYRVLCIPLPRVRLFPKRIIQRPGEPRGRFVDLLSGGLASLSTRAGSLVVLMLLLVRQGRAAPPDALTLEVHLAAPLFATASTVTQVFYLDFKRLMDHATGLLRRRFERAVAGVSLVAGTFLWIVAAALGHLVIPAGERGQLFGLLPVFLALGYLATLQIRDFAFGDWMRASLGGVVVLGGAFAARTLPFISTERHVLALGVILTVGILVLRFVAGLVRRPSSVGFTSSFLEWRRGLFATRCPVRIGGAILAKTSPASQRKAAVVWVAETLNASGTVWSDRLRRLVWYERIEATFVRQPLAGPLDNMAFIVGTGGILDTCQILPPAPDGKTALTAAAKAGLLEPAWSTERLAVREACGDLLIAFRALFPTAVTIDLLHPRGDRRLRGLSPRVRQALWTDALWETRGLVSRRSSPFDVTVFQPGGEIMAVFACDRQEPAENRRKWRNRVYDASLSR